MRTKEVKACGFIVGLQVSASYVAAMLIKIYAIFV
jgi:hypothetical protein